MKKEKESFWDRMIDTKYVLLDELERRKEEKERKRKKMNIEERIIKEIYILLWTFVIIGGGCYILSFFGVNLFGWIGGL